MNARTEPRRATPVTPARSRSPGLCLALCAAVVMGAVLTPSAYARHGDDGRREWRGDRNYRFDGRHHHDHYYPAAGYVVGGLPSGALSIRFGPVGLFFHGGVWYQPHGPRFRVVMPPVGIVIPVLPPAYATVWLGGAPYYYANGTYYSPCPGGYSVVAPPPQVEQAQVVPLPPPPPHALPDPVLYPRHNQPPDLIEADRQACNRWATTQPNAMADAHVFQRAVSACLDGRGYTVR